MKLFSALTLQRLSLGSVSAFALLGLAACGDDDKNPGTDTGSDTDGSDTDGSDTDSDTDTDDIPDTTGGEGSQTDPNAISTQPEGEGFRTYVNAESGELWAHFSFESSGLVVPTEANPAFDLAFQRFLIKLGPDAKVAVLDEADWDSLDVAPSSGYQVDPEPVEGEEPSGVNTSGDKYVMGNWWTYDMSSHQLSPTPNRVYVVSTASGAYYKLRVRDYYDEGGSPGHLVFDWAEVEAPSDVVEPIEEGVLIPSGNQFYDLETGALVTETDGWDIKFMGTNIATASGLTDDTGFGGVYVTSDAFADVAATDTVGFQVDSNVEVRGAGGASTIVASALMSNWYDYDMATHTPSPKDQTYIVRSREGNYFKLRILSWSMDGFRITSEAIERAPQVNQITLASGGDLYANLSLGTTMAAPAEDAPLGWDLGMVSWYFKTNGGESGTGLGGAYEAEQTDLAAIESVPVESVFVADSAQTGRRGASVTYNTALKSWFNYDSTTHAMSAADRSYVVRLVDGSFAKMKVTSFELSGMSFTLTLDYVYAGPGHSEF